MTNFSTHRLQQLLRLTPRDWGDLLLALGLLPLLVAALRIRGFRWTHGFLSGHIPERARPATANALQDRASEARSLARMVSVAGNHGICRANCLGKSLLTWWLLRRRGIDARFRIGIQKDREQFGAHAWVEYAGIVLLDAPDIAQRYSPLVSNHSARI